MSRLQLKIHAMDVEYVTYVGIYCRPNRSLYAWLGYIKRHALHV